MELALPTHLLHIPWAIGVVALIGFGVATAWFVRIFRRAPTDPPAVPGPGRRAADKSAVARDRRG